MIFSISITDFCFQCKRVYKKFSEPFSFPNQKKRIVIHLFLYFYFFIHLFINQVNDIYCKLWKILGIETWNISITIQLSRRWKFVQGDNTVPREGLDGPPNVQVSQVVLRFLVITWGWERHSYVCGEGGRNQQDRAGCQRPSGSEQGLWIREAIYSQNVNKNKYKEDPEWRVSLSTVFHNLPAPL